MNAEARELSGVLEDARGVLLSGPAGIGKSHLAELVCAERAAAGDVVVPIRATFGTTELPLGAFAGFLGSADQPVASLFIEVRRALASQADGRPLLLVVDDIHLLDEASSALVHQFVVEGQARLLCSMRTGQQALPGVLDLLHSGLLRRHEVTPLDLDQVHALVADLLGCPVDDSTARRLLTATDGNPLFVKELVLASLESGRVERDGDQAAIAVLATDAPRLVDVVRGRLAHLSAADLEALRHIAFAEPCEPAELASVADADTLVRLESAEVILSSEDRNRLVVRLAHPIYGEVLRASTGLLQRRAILAALASDLAARGVSRPSDVIKLARLAVDGGIDVDNSVLRRAVPPTMQAGQLDLAERIARQLMDNSDSFHDGMELGRILQYQGDLDGMREHLRVWRPRARTAGEHRAVALLEAAVERSIGNDAPLADRLIDEAIERYPETGEDWAPVSERDMRAERCIFRVGVAPNAELEREVEQYLTDERSLVRLRAHVAASLVHGLGHRADLARHHVQAACDILASFGADNSLATIAIRIYESLAAVTGGDFVSAEQVMSDALADAADDTGFSLASLYLAIPRALSGRPDSALQVMEAHIDRWDRCRGFMPPRYRWIMRLLCAATAGDVEAARRALEEYQRDPGCLHSLDVFADLGAIRLAAADARPAEAAALAMSTGDHWQELGLGYAEAMCRYELVRMGDVDAEIRLGELAEQCEGHLVEAFAAHARSLRQNDGDALAEVAERFLTMGAALYASEAAVHASEAFRRSQDQRAANRLLTRATELRNRCDAALTTLPMLDSGVVALSKREREVAMLAAQGMTSRDIGQRLFISFRTAENHLAKAYDKLGVRSRAELSRVLDGGVDALVV
jgi:DNA-binding CsgD family transcriptional regulator